MHSSILSVSRALFLFLLLLTQMWHVCLPSDSGPRDDTFTSLASEGHR